MAECKGELPKADYFKVKNDWWDALLKYNIPGEQRRCLDFIIRQTYGWQKKEAKITITEFSNATGLNRASVSRAIKKLSQNKLIVYKKVNDRHVTYSFNKYYKRWKWPKKKKPFVYESVNEVSIRLVNDKRSRLVNDRKITPIIVKDNIKTIKDSTKKTKKRAAPGNFKSDELKKKAEYLYNQNIFPKVHSFINTQIKRKQNELAIGHCLDRCYYKHKNGGFKNNDPWAYCQKIMSVESGNYNERSHVAEAQRQKKELQELIDNGI